MKKYLRMIRNIIFFGVVYSIMQVIFIFLYGIMYSLVCNTKSSKAVEEAVTNNLYIVTAVGCAITLIIYMLVLKNKKENLGQRCNFAKIKGSYIANSIILAISTSLICIPMVYFLSSKFKSYGQVSESIVSAHGSVLSMICIIVLIPIFEEILFRGLIFNELKKNMNIVIAVIVQALIFGLAHGNMLQGIYAFILGVILSILYIYTKSIWSNIIGHIVFNLFGSLILPMVLPDKKSYVAICLGAGIIVTTMLLINMLKKHKKTTTFNQFS